MREGQFAVNAGKETAGKLGQYSTFLGCIQPCVAVIILDNKRAYSHFPCFDLCFAVCCRLAGGEG